MNLQISARQRQPPHQKENNGEAFQRNEELDSFLPEEVSLPLVEQETFV